MCPPASGQTTPVGPTTNFRQSATAHRAKPTREIVYAFGHECPEAFARAKGKNAARAEVDDDNAFIIDTGATISCTKSLHLLHHNTFVNFEADEQVRILGISGDQDLISPGEGQLQDEFHATRALYVPDASANILSWWSIKKTHRVQVKQQDEEDERLELTNKSSGEITRCYVHPPPG